jgi:hypothetical protein
MNYLVQPQTLIERALRIESFSSMFSKEQIQFSELIDISTQIVEEWSSDWDEGQGFGSSDGTYMLKDFMDTVISNFTNSVYKKSGYQTVFQPSLMIIKL